MVYADTSALVKRYLIEPFSSEFETLFMQAPLVTSRLSLVEMRCAVARKRRDRQITARIENRVTSEMATDIQDGALLIGEVGAAHFTAAFHLIDRLSGTPLRALDALHLAVAEQLAASAFATADRHQADAAEALGLTVHRFC
ncbi:MAG: type II toxin-antitoxin system VapC family toxin [Rhizobium sp.]|nr:type II toxin-antitoxin system VapC family toxin [Rhizobium sp.]